MRLILVLTFVSIGGCKASRTGDIVWCVCDHDEFPGTPDYKVFCVGEDDQSDDGHYDCGEERFCGDGFPAPNAGLDQNACKPGFRWWVKETFLPELAKNPVQVAEFMLAKVSAGSPYNGTLVESGAELSRIRARRGGGAYSAWVPVRGSASLMGELCPAGSCAIALEFLRAETKQSFTVAGDNVTRFILTNAGPWSGYKEANDMYYFQRSSAVTVGARVNGTNVTGAAEAVRANNETNTVRGAFVWPSGGLPLMTINGSFTDGDYTVELDLAFNLNNAAPEAWVFAPTSACPANSRYEAHAASPYYAASQLSMRWFDQTGAVIATGKCLSNSVCGQGAGPVVLEVKDPGGRASYAQATGDPVLGVPRAGESFGASVAAGDFNGDGYADIIAGAPQDYLDGYSGPEQGLCGDLGCNPDMTSGCEPTIMRAGAAVALYGSPNGVSARNGQFLSQYTLPTWGTEELGDQFGAALAVGNFDGDAYDDVAVGVPGENHPGGASDGPGEGAVNVFYGSTGGLKPDSKHTDSVVHNGFNQGTSGVPDAPEVLDSFGYTLAAGDFNRDGAADLAVGVPGEDSFAGAVVIIPGVLHQGLSGTGSRIIRQSSFGLQDEGTDMFGFALAAGDINNDGYAELAIGAPGEDAQAGAVTVLYGSSNGLQTDSSRWTLTPTDERKGQFGYALVIADLDGNGYSDLAVGSPAATVNGVSRMGLVTGFVGSSTGLTYNYVVYTPGGASSYGTLYGPAPADSRFGAALAAGYVDGDERADLIATMPDLSFPSGPQNAGFAILMLSWNGARYAYDIDGTSASIQDGDRFGRSVVLADVDRNGRDDVVFGVPGEFVREDNAGLVRVLMAPDHLDKGSRVDTFSQDTQSPPPPPRAYRGVIIN